MVLDITEIEYFFIVLELHTIEYNFFFLPFFYFTYSQVLFYLSVSRRGTLSFFFFLSPVGTHSCKSKKLIKSKKMESIYGQRKEAWIWFACQVLFWPSSLTIHEHFKFTHGLDVRYSSWPSSLTIHEEHLMQALAFLYAWNFLNIVHFPEMGIQAI